MNSDVVDSRRVSPHQSSGTSCAVYIETKTGTQGRLWMQMHTSYHLDRIKEDRIELWDVIM